MKEVGAKVGNGMFGSEVAASGDRVCGTVGKVGRAGRGGNCGRDGNEIVGNVVGNVGKGGNCGNCGREGTTGVVCRRLRAARLMFMLEKETTMKKAKMKQLLEAMVIKRLFFFVLK